MNGDALLDANAVIAHFKDSTVYPKFQKYDNLYLPVIVLGELIFGAHKSGNLRSKLERLENFLLNVRMLDVSRETATHYGQIKSDLSQSGKMIPENDLWIAALAHQHQLTLISRDKHFEAIGGLNLADWQ